MKFKDLIKTKKTWPTMYWDIWFLIGGIILALYFLYEAIQNFQFSFNMGIKNILEMIIVLIIVVLVFNSVRKKLK
jgi:hypothetical protein